MSIPGKKVVKNVGGAALILLGLILWITPIVPGGVLAIAGLTLLDFPGKKWLGRKLRQIEVVDRAWTWLMRKVKRERATPLDGVAADPASEGGSDERKDTAQTGRPDGNGR